MIKPSEFTVIGELLPELIINILLTPSLVRCDMEAESTSANIVSETISEPVIDAFPSSVPSHSSEEPPEDVILVMF